MTTTLERYQRIAPLYDLLDLPFEYSAIDGSGHCCSTASRAASWMLE